MSDNTQILPDLDDSVLEALELFKNSPPPSFPTIHFKSPLIVGSGNAYWIGRILFEDKPAVFADENDFENLLKTNTHIDGAVIISASGGKSSIEIAKTLKEKGLETILLTTQVDSEASQFIKKENVHLFPHHDEPYSYNVSTYLGMLLSHIKEDPNHIQEVIKNLEEKLPNDLKRLEAFVLLLPSELHLLRGIFVTKFEELFGSRVRARAYTFEEFKHAKSIVPSEFELFISFGETPEDIKTLEGLEIFSLPLPPKPTYPLAMALGYYFIGRIQKTHPPYFKTNLNEYLEKTKYWFDNSK